MNGQCIKSKQRILVRSCDVEDLMSLQPLIQSISTLSRGRRVPRETAILLRVYRSKNTRKLCYSKYTIIMALPLPPGLTPNEVASSAKWSR